MNCPSSIVFHDSLNRRYESDESRWQAVAGRDAGADGAFFFAVRTTGVFCRPSCASRAPRRENVTFFATTDEAAAAGYRPCKRCQPTSLPRELAIVERACKVLDADPHERMTLAQLSDAVHVSPFHLQRVFSRIVGVSPRQYQAARRADVLRDALQRGHDVTRATHDAGFGSPSRMYEAAPADLGMTPSAYRRKGAGLTVRFATAATPLGAALVAATDKGVCKIAFGDDAATLVDQLAADFSQAERVEDGARMEPFIARIRAYLQGTREQLTCRSTSARPRFSAACGTRCGGFPTVRRAAIRRSPRRSGRRARCGRWRMRAGRIRSRWRFRVIA